MRETGERADRAEIKRLLSAALDLADRTDDPLVAALVAEALAALNRSSERGDDA